MTALHLEHYLGLGKLDQLALKGPTDTYEEVSLSATGFDSQRRRIVLRDEETEEVYPPISILTPATSRPRC